MMKLSPQEWQAVNPYLDQALDLSEAERLLRAFTFLSCGG